jgi:hypothetical protein
MKTVDEFALFERAANIERCGEFYRLTFEDDCLSHFRPEHLHSFEATRQSDRRVDLTLIESGPAIQIMDSLDELISRLPILPRDPCHVFFIKQPEFGWRVLERKSFADEQEHWKSYVFAARLARLVSSAADVQSAGKFEFVFFGVSRTVIRVAYTIESLVPASELMWNNLASIEDSLKLPGRRDYAKTVIRNSLSRFLSGRAVDDRFEALLASSELFCESCVADYRMFLNSDGYDSAVAELVRVNNSVIKSANEAFSSIYTKLLAVPLAFVFVHTKISELPVGADEPRRRIIVTVALGVLLLLAIASVHVKSALMIKNNLDLEKKNQLFSGALSKSQVDETFGRLEKNIVFQMWVVGLFVALLLIFNVGWSVSYWTIGGK